MSGRGRYPVRDTALQCLAQQLSGNLIDGGPPAGLMNDLAFFSKAGVSVFAECSVIVMVLFDVEGYEKNSDRASCGLISLR